MSCVFEQNNAAKQPLKKQPPGRENNSAVKWQTTRYDPNIFIKNREGIFDLASWKKPIATMSGAVTSWTIIF